MLDHKLRAYFKREKGMPYDDRGKRVNSARNATSFVEAEIRVIVGATGKEMDDVTRAIIRDAFMSGQYAVAQRMAWECGFPIRISVCGVAGDVTSPRYARRMAREYTRDSLEDAVTDIGEWNQQWGTNFRSWDRATKHVLDTDGEYAGLEVHDEVYLDKRTTRVLVMHSGGQIREEILEAFPELKTICDWHLSDMRAGAPDQERALAPWYLTEAWRTERTSEKRNAHLAYLGILESQSDEQILVNGAIRSARGYRYGSAHVAHWIPDEVLHQLHVLAEASEKERAA